MKITRDMLKGLISEVLSDNRIIKEATQNVKYDRIMKLLSGDVGAVDQVVIVTPENPHAIPLTPQQNKNRTEEFEKELAHAGYGFRTVSGMYEGPEDSYVIPHMTLADAKKYSYKYGQQTFIHSRRQEAPETEGQFFHGMYEIDFSKATENPAYDKAEYGPGIYNTVSSVGIKDITPSSTISGHDKMASATDYYSHIPDEKWAEKEKGVGKDRKVRPAGEKLGKRFSIDFFNDQETPFRGNQDIKLKDPKYIRESRYIIISSEDASNAPGSKKLVDEISILSKKVNESTTLGSHVRYSRLKLVAKKRELLKLMEGSK
jgi:hypothetical protein